MKLSEFIAELNKIKGDPDVKLWYLRGDYADDGYWSENFKLINDVGGNFNDLWIEGAA